MNTNDKTILSLDIKSLFANNPLTETIDYIYEQLLGKKIEITISTNKIKGLLSEYNMNVYFMLNNEVYRLIDRVATGSLLGSILANIFLVKPENEPLKDILNKLDYYRRYIEDTLIVCDESINKQELLNNFNNIHLTIKFTRKEEKDHSIAFLDVLLSERIDGSIKRNIYFERLHGRVNIPVSIALHLFNTK